MLERDLGKEGDLTARISPGEMLQRGECVDAVGCGLCWDAAPSPRAPQTDRMWFFFTSL